MSEERKWKLYCHTNKINGKMYFGITSKSLKQRFNKDGSGYKACSRFHAAIQKYGWDGFAHEIVRDNLTKSEASMLEQGYIALFGTTDARYGYNIQSGGYINSEVSAEGRRRNGDAHRGPHSPCAVPVTSFDLSGNKLMDFPYIKAACEHYGISDSSVWHSLSRGNGTCHGMLFRYTKDVEGIDRLSDEYMNSIVRARHYKNGKHAKCTDVVLFDRDGNYACAFSSMKDAAEFLGVYHGNISNCLSGRVKSVKGYYVRLKADVGNALTIDVSNIYETRTLAVVQLSPEGQPIATYKSLRLAARAVNGDHKQLKRAAIKGKIYHGYLWRLAE